MYEDIDDNFEACYNNWVEINEVEDELEDFKVRCVYIIMLSQGGKERRG